MGFLLLLLALAICPVQAEPSLSASISRYLKMTSAGYETGYTAFESSVSATTEDFSYALSGWTNQRAGLWQLDLAAGLIGTGHNDEYQSGEFFAAFGLEYVLARLTLLYLVDTGNSVVYRAGYDQIDVAVTFDAISRDLLGVKLDLPEKLFLDYLNTAGFISYYDAALSFGFSKMSWLLDSFVADIPWKVTYYDEKVNIGAEPSLELGPLKASLYLDFSTIGGKLELYVLDLGKGVAFMDAYIAISYNSFSQHAELLTVRDKIVISVISRSREGPRH